MVHKKNKFKFKTAPEYVAWLDAADVAYYKKVALVSDAEYDYVRDELKARFPDEEYLTKVGTKEDSSLPKNSGLEKNEDNSST